MTKLGKSGKDIVARQARIAARRQSDARLQRQMQQLQGSMVRPAQAPKVPAATPQFIIASPSGQEAASPAHSIHRQGICSTEGRFNSVLNRGNMLVDLLSDIP